MAVRAAAMSDPVPAAVARIAAFRRIVLPLAPIALAAAHVAAAVASVAAAAPIAATIATAAGGGNDLTSAAVPATTGVGDAARARAAGVRAARVAAAPLAASARWAADLRMAQPLPAAAYFAEAAASGIGGQERS